MGAAILVLRAWIAACFYGIAKCDVDFRKTKVYIYNKILYKLL